MEVYKCVLLILVFIHAVHNCSASLEEGKWDYNLTEVNHVLVMSKSLFANSQIFIKGICVTKENTKPENITFTWTVVQSSCWDPTSAIAIKPDLMPTDHTTTTQECNDHVLIKTDPVYNTSQDGIYTLMLQIANSTTSNLSVHIEMKGKYGYLSAIDWPLFPFYSFVCVFYMVFGLVWLVTLYMQWNYVMHIHIWIEAVIILGMLENLVFYEEFRSVNNTGTHIHGGVLIAEWLSCAKRTLARMLVIIISLGWEIVGSRIKIVSNRLIAIGLLYFCLAALEAYLRVTSPRYSIIVTTNSLAASVSLAVLDSFICWWICGNLRSRKNDIELSLHWHSTNIFIFYVIASITFMLYVFKIHHMVVCLDWKNLWLVNAYWQCLFAIVLFAIVILWRPTNTIPLLIIGDDEEELLVNDTYGVKINHQQISALPKKHSLEINWKKI